MPAGLDLPSGEAVDEFFQTLEARAPFPEAALAALLPEGLLAEWQNIAATQSVPWPWVMMSELALASFLTPNARFQPIASFNVYSLTWTFFLHPGSCHTSNLLRLYHNTLYGVERKANEELRAKRTVLRQQAAPDAAAQAEIKARLRKLADVNMCLGTGSLEGIGLRMSGCEGRTSAAGFLVEGTQFLQWLSAEFGVKKAIATQLWERMAWQRDVINNLRSFSMPYPFLGVCGALHLEDVWPLYSVADPLGLRGRLCFVYSRPAMKRARDIMAANDALGNSRGSNALEDRLVERFFHVYKAHALEHQNEARFSHHLGYPFLNYAFSPQDDNKAEKLFIRHFDTQAHLQEENYLVRHEVSKRHGKLKGKHLRLALNWHNVLLSFEGVLPSDWTTELSAHALQAAELIGKHNEAVSDLLADFVARAKAQKADPASGPGADSGSRTLAARVGRLRGLPFQDFLNDAPPDIKQHLIGFAASVLQMRTTWLDATLLKAHSYVRDAFPEAPDQRLPLVWRVLILLEKLQLLSCGLTINPSGPRRLLAVKRPSTDEALENENVVGLLRDTFHVEPSAYFGPATAAAAAERPTNAPGLGLTVFNAASFLADLQVFRAWAA